MDADKISDFVGEFLTFCIMVLHRSKHRSEKEHESVGIIVVPSLQSVVHQFFGIPTDLFHKTKAFKVGTLRPVDSEADISPSHVVQTDF